MASPAGSTSVADPGEGPGEPGSPLFFDQILFRKKKLLETAPPPYLRVWMTAPTSLPVGLDPPH